MLDVNVNLGKMHVHSRYGQISVTQNSLERELVALVVQLLHRKGMTALGVRATYVARWQRHVKRSTAT